MPKFYLSILLLVSLASKGQFYDEKYTTQELIQKKEQAKLLTATKKNKESYVKALVNLAARYNKIQKFDSSLILSKEALPFAEKSGNYFLIASTKLNIGHAYENKELYFEASRYFEESILAAKLAKDDSLLSLSYYLGGMCYNAQKESNRALYLLKKGEKLCKSKLLYNQLSRCLNTMGNIYSDNHKPDSALIFYKECLIVSTQNNIERMVAVSYKNIGKILLYSNDPNEGIKNIEKSISLFLSSKKKIIRDLVIYSYSELAKYYNTTKDIEKASKYAHLGIKLNESLHYTDVQLELSKVLYKHYKALGKTNNALQYLEKYQESADKINADFLQQQHAALEQRFKGEQQKNQIILLNQEKKAEEKQRNWLIISLLIVSMFVVFTFYLYRTIKKQKSKIEAINQNLEVKVIERTAELQAAYDDIKNAMLRGQTLERKRVAADLHDNLGSLLSAMGVSLEVVNVDNFTEKEKFVFQNVQNQLQDAYREIRLISHNLQPAELEKQGLQKAVERLVEKINQSQKIKLYFDSHEIMSFSKEVEFNIYSILLELVNNTIKHAHANNIKITFSKTDNQNWQLRYSDDGNGFDKISSEGFGLQNIKSRLEQINGKLEVLEGKGINYLISFVNY
jgi:signal transduction histidine kinase